MIINEQKLDKLAELAIKTGVALKNGQDLLLTAPIESLPLVKRIAIHAYKEGANIVTPIFSDPDITLARFEHASEISFDKAPNWLFDGMGKAFDNNTARLAIVGEDPLLLSNQDPNKVGRANKANSIAYKPAREKITSFKINWNIISWPGKAWAGQVFPNLEIEAAQSKLADAIFTASRVDSLDPISEWAKHNTNLKKWSDWLNERNFNSLHFQGPGTNLFVGLAEDHEWMGGASMAQNGIICNPNIPSEEVFTTPHAHRVEGKVCATKPLSHQGSLIEDIQVKFERGKIIDAQASKGKEVLMKILDSDEGARRLGEVALVPDSSPIAQTGLLFYNTLFDENAACHIALGQCYTKCFKNQNLTKEEIASKGGNSSMIHIDWMIGSNQIDIDGIKQNGEITPIFRKGKWAQKFN